MGLFSECCCAATASGVATAIANPFEVAKTRLQLQGANAASAVRYRGSVHAVVAMLRHEGLAGAYRGFGAFAGEAPGMAADIYALGVLLLEMLTGTEAADTLSRR